MNIDAKETKIEYVKRVGLSQVVVECDINTSNHSKVAKLLSVTGNVLSGKIECFKGEAKVSGKMNYKVLYLDEDNKIEGIEYCSDFVESIGNSDINIDSHLFSSMNVVDIDSMTENGVIRLQAVIDIDLMQIIHHDVNVITGTSDLITKCQNIKTSVHIGSIDDKVDVSDTYKTGSNIDRVLLEMDSLVVDSIKCIQDAVKVSGEVNACILYSSEGKEYSKRLNMPFDECIKCPHVTDASMACVYAQVEDSKIVLDGVQDDNNINVAIVLGIKGEVFDYGEESVLSDAFSSDVELEISREEVEFGMIDGYKSVVERLEGEVSIEDSDSIKRLIAIIPKVGAMVNVKQDKGGIIGDVLIGVDVIYLNQSDECKVVTTQIPASVKLGNVDEDDFRIIPHIDIVNTSGRVKRDRDIDMLVDVAISICIVKNVNESVIVDIKEGEAKVNKHKMMSIYFAKSGDSMWDIEKCLGANADSIISTNPNIDFDNIKGGERIIYRREK